MKVNSKKIKTQPLSLYSKDITGSANRIPSGRLFESLWALTAGIYWNDTTEILCHIVLRKTTTSDTVILKSSSNSVFCVTWPLSVPSHQLCACVVFYVSISQLNEALMLNNQVMLDVMWLSRCFFSHSLIHSFHLALHWPCDMLHLLGIPGISGL